VRKLYFIFFILLLLTTRIEAQFSFEISPSLGCTFTPAINYKNCTGNINSSFTEFNSLIFHANQSWGFALIYNYFKPTTFLNDTISSVGVYTRSQITVERLLGGVNYYFTIKKVHPYIGGLFGLDYAATTQNYLPTSFTSFCWGGQAGVDYYFSYLLGVRLNGTIINSPGIPNNSAWFNVNKNGEGFPSYAVGNPSTAGIIQMNVSLGIIVRFMKDNNQKQR
jgi:hypothetical protein